VSHNRARADPVPLYRIQGHQSGAGQVTQGGQVAGLDAARLGIVGAVGQLRQRAGGGIAFLRVGVCGRIAGGDVRTAVGRPPELVLFPLGDNLPVGFTGQGQPGNSLTAAIQLDDKAGWLVQCPGREVGEIDAGGFHTGR
jgi:hypothetical protein